LHSLSTLRAAIADDDARLASGGLPAFAGRGFHPSGPYERFRALPTYSSPFPELRLARHTTRRAGPHRAVPTRCPGLPMNTRHDPRITSRALSISHGAALTGNLAHTGVIGASILPAVERPLASSVLPDIESSGVFVFAGISQPPARCAVVRPLLTSLQVAPSGSPHVRTRCFPARPPHLPRRRNRSTSLCCASSSPRRRPSMRFLSVSPLVSASLPSPGRLPSRSWPRVVGLSCRHAGSSYRGLAPHLQRAHDGRTQAAAGYRRIRAESTAGALCPEIINLRTV